METWFEHLLPEKQQFTRINKMVDLIISLGNLKAMMELNDKCVSTETEKDNKRYYKKKYVKNMRFLGRKGSQNCKRR